MFKLHYIVCVIIVDRKEWRLFFKVDLGNVDNSTHHNAMLASIMPEDLPERSPLLEPAIDCFMTSPSHFLHVLIIVVQRPRHVGTVPVFQHLDVPHAAVLAIR